MRGDADLENEEELVEFVLKVMNRKKEKNWDYNINPFSLRKFSYTNDLPLDPLTLRKLISLNAMQIKIFLLQHTGCFF